jgi:hypothetical protein
MHVLTEAVGDLFLPPSSPTPLLSNSEVGSDGVCVVVGGCGSGRLLLCSSTERGQFGASSWPCGSLKCPISSMSVDAGRTICVGKLNVDWESVGNGSGSRSARPALVGTHIP